MAQQKALVDRRNFLALGAAGTLGLGAASVTAAATAKADEATAATSSKYGFEIAPEAIAESQVAETVETEVVVVGAGTAGLCTALSALEAGLQVVVVTASTTPISRGGSNNATNCAYMEEAGIAPMDKGLMIRKEFVANAGAADMQKWARYFQYSEESANWLDDHMKEAGLSLVVESSVPYAEGDVCFTPSASLCWVNEENSRAGSTQALVVNALADAILAQGGRIDYGMIARQLVRGGEANGTQGRVDAVIAEGADGTYAKYVGAKAVVLATGDFSGDREMMEAHCPDALPLVSTDKLDGEVDYDQASGFGGIYKGDGQKMGLWVGAAWQHNPMCAPMSIAVGDASIANYALHWGLLLNARGERFMNEDFPFAFGVGPIMKQPGSVAFAIWDDDYANYWTDWHASSTTCLDDPMTADEIRASWSQGYDTLEEAIEAAGLPLETTLASIERYNELCDKGSDDDFFKTAEKMHPIRTAPFYVGHEMPIFLTVLGGLRTNVNMQVCDADDAPIEGLYNVGTMVGDFYGGIYTFMMEGFNYGACRTFGYLTGRYIAEHE